jgi:O-antigen ligase
MQALILKTLLVCTVLCMPIQNMFRGLVSLPGLNLANLLFVLTLLLVWLRGPVIREPAPLKGAFGFFFAVLIWGYCIGQAYDSSQWATDLSELKNNIFYMSLFFLFYAAVADLKTVRLLFAAILLITFLSSVQGLRQALDYGLATYNESRRVAAPFSWSYTDANRSAVFFCIFLPLFAAAALFYKSRPVLRLGCLACLLLGVFVVFFTYSRQAYFILGLLALLLTLRRSLVISVLILVALLNFEYWAPETAVQRVQMTTHGEDGEVAQTQDGEVKYDESTESRFVIWEGARQLIESRPWGVGLNHFKREIGLYVPQNKNMDAHNFYVLITTEAGVVAPVALLVLIIGLLRLARRVEKAEAGDEARVFGIGYGACVVAVVMGSFYGSRFLDGDVMGNFWILSGVMARYRSLVLEARSRAVPVGIGANAETNAKAGHDAFDSHALIRARG